MALRSTGLSQSLHFTMPISDFSGWAPNIFISRADSHDVGGDGSDATFSVFGGGEEGNASHENAGGDSLAGLSLSDMMVRRKTTTRSRQHQLLYNSIQPYLSCNVLAYIYISRNQRLSE